MPGRDEHGINIQCRKVQRKGNVLLVGGGHNKYFENLSKTAVENVNKKLIDSNSKSL